MVHQSTIYEVRNGTPEQNIEKVIEMMGGITRFIGEDDIIVLKPNAQWWNQGMTNTNAMKGFIELVLNIPRFRGEIIIAENHHFISILNSNNRGWTTKFRNGDFNFNELVEYFQYKGYRNITKYHWINAGLNFEEKTLKNKLHRPIKETVKKILNKLNF